VGNTVIGLYGVDYIQHASMPREGLWASETKIRSVAIIGV
jgi:hypothetical protein